MDRSESVGLEGWVFDRRLILLSAGLRATATGVAGVLLGVHFAKVGLDLAQIEAVVGAGLAGAALAGGTVAERAERIGSDSQFFHPG